MTSEQRNIVAQWAFDTRPVLLRFHLWLEDVQVERAQPEPVSAHSFTPRGIARCLASWGRGRTRLHVPFDRRRHPFQG